MCFIELYMVWIYLSIVVELPNFCKQFFSPNRPTGPIRSSSRDVCPYVSMLSPPHAIFWRPWTGAERLLPVDWCGASLARGLVRSVPRPCVEP